MDTTPRTDLGQPAARFRRALPQLTADLFLTDGGLETTLVFHRGIDLPDFAAYVLLDEEDGRSALRDYFRSYLDIARREGVGIVLETPTWRASPDWAARHGVPLARLADLHREAVAMLHALRDDHATPMTPVVVSGCIGPRGDGYVAGRGMGASEAAAYHGFQAHAFAEAGVDLITAMTMTSSAEATGVAAAALAVGVPSVISFTVETDGVLPSGEPLGAAIEAVDAATEGSVAYFMVNCAHPSHLAGALDERSAWIRRLGGLRANASRMSHEELDAATELDDGDPAELGSDYQQLRERFPQLRVLGGCCGTDHRHVDAIATACAR